MAPTAVKQIQLLFFSSSIPAPLKTVELPDFRRCQTKVRNGALAMGGLVRRKEGGALVDELKSSNLYYAEEDIIG